MRKLILAAIFACCGVSMGADASAAAPGRPPNVVILFTDDQGYNDLGCFGSPSIKTPRIDRMAAEGARFTDFYVAAPVCTPSRAALLTGCYPPRIGMGQVPAEPELKRPTPKDVMYPHSLYGLNPDEITIAELVKQKGYATQAIGKWHLGDRPRYLPTRQGFDHWLGIPYSNDQKPSVLMRDEQVVETPVEQDSLIERYTDEAVKFIKDSKDRPFFLYLAYSSPHVPIHVGERFRGKSKRGPYGDAIEEIDWSAGTIVDTLRELGLEKDTLVVFASDNGPWLWKGEAGGSATPFRSGKRTTYEGAMRVPCVMYWPGHIPAGQTCREVASTIDLFPTIAALTGAKVPTDRVIDGKDIRPLMFGEAGAKSPHEAFYYYNGNQLDAVRSGNWKLKFRATLMDEFGYGTYENPTTPIPEALYNLDEDPGEQKSVAQDHPDIVKRLTELADKARYDLGDERRGMTGHNVRPIGHIVKPATKPS